MTLTWTKRHEADGLEARYERELADARKKALALNRWLCPFQTLASILTRPVGRVQLDMGRGGYLYSEFQSSPDP